ncbi:hypothetical protein J5249_00477 [Campylobacter fetus subsp. fetus]|uniref:type II toxin-antitoxin system RelB family antitoxin n=1 Tax=Campylobacter fetus TaxID=196 RepID=UPI001AEC8540|nr:type II toxin-antitoxin system RelE/ParE family toxin [Campylobacter fetus]QYA64603.1 hypothetical protein J5249_00477 [Campylobacter fetus subsp. fetus]
MQVSFRLDDDLADRLDNLAKETKRSKSFYFKEAISNLLDDFDDYKDAIKSIKDSENEKTYTIDDMSKNMEFCLKVLFNKSASKNFSKLDGSIKTVILKKLKVIESLENPRCEGKALVGNMLGLWRYRIGDYRVIAQIQDDKLVILVVKIAHRKDVYE